ncbi:hypothetical protein ATE48_07185 [Candidatus Viadribacter manganicus]|uniref:Uncharacterized protein n=2 Tax=Candidatus Viadribacter manganicus TaxID=1759059 RepID=A0A1B1AGM4_9PROT|nr:hypothetical protein ATE48_07185 [Candidatus Viadribacter manganicus]
MTKKSPPSRSTRLLLEEGAFEAGPPRARRRDLVLSRALCRYRFFERPADLSNAEFAKARQLFAEAHAPYPNTGMMILRAPKGASIWYWDKAKSAEFPNAEISPESVWRGVGEDGWRVITCAEGYEAQYWQDKTLIASSWRRQALSAAQWRAFVLSVEAQGLAAPELAPSPIEAAFADGAWRRSLVKAPLSWADVEKIGFSAALCALAASALFCGQGLRFGAYSAEARARHSELEARFRDDRELARALLHYRQVEAFSAASDRALVLTALTEAQETAGEFGLNLRAWRADSAGLSFSFESAIGETPVREIVSAIEAQPHLCNATPEIAGPREIEVRADLSACEGADLDTVR